MDVNKSIFISEMDAVGEICSQLHHGRGNGLHDGSAVSAGNPMEMFSVGARGNGGGNGGSGDRNGGSGDRIRDAIDAIQGIQTALVIRFWCTDVSPISLHDYAVEGFAIGQ